MIILPQLVEKMLSIEDTFHLVSTPVITTASTFQIHGTSFFYNEFSEVKPGGPNGWKKFEKTWLITNRHMLLPKVEGKETIPDSLSFYLRKTINGKSLRWEPITLDKSQVISRAKVHENKDVDVAAIYVLDLLIEKANSGGTYMGWGGINKGQFAGNNNIHVEVGDEALVIGYPRGFYDEVNLYPIVKSGIIASAFGLPFGGKPIFLIDAKLFPGSSGSLVVSRPTNAVVVNGKPLYNKYKQFAFLGIYSGEYAREEFNIGIVWHAFLIEQVIRSVKSITD